MFTLLNLENLNSENVENKECVHNWAKDTCYTSTKLIKMIYSS